jgi:hypothetical protein
MLTSTGASPNFAQVVSCAFCRKWLPHIAIDLASKKGVPMRACKMVDFARVATRE